MNIISSETCLLGVIGDPIRHSLSPIIHNAALKEMNLNWTYMAIPCKSKDLKLVLHAMQAIDCKGLNITIPHKTSSLQYCNNISSLGEEIGAVNTLIPDHRGGWKGENTDIEGFLKPLNNTKLWEKKNAVVIGCGGSAKAIIAGLKTLNLKKISILNRSQNSLDKLINTLKVHQEKLQIESFLFRDDAIKEIIKNANLIINTTPVGMYNPKNNVNQVPLGHEIWENLKAGTTLYDLIYNPKPTEWLKIGLKKDCNIINGLEMLIHQGAASLRLWSGVKEIPIDIMRKAAESYSK